MEVGLSEFSQHTDGEWRKISNSENKKRDHERNDEIHSSLFLCPLPCPPSPPLLVCGHQPVTSWLLVWLLSLALPTVPLSVLCSRFAMLSKFRTYRPAGNTLQWTTKTCFTSTCTQIMQLSAGRSWISSSTTTGKQWRWCTKTAQVWDSHDTSPGHVGSEQRESECSRGINSSGGVHENALLHEANGVF